MIIEFGIDNLLAQNVAWKKKNLALVTNHAATTNSLIPTRKALLNNGFNIVKLFSPEHGLDSLGEDGAKMIDEIDSLTNLPVISLYSNKLQPLAEDFIDIDFILFDIPDIGCRCYTYLWTMTYVLEACSIYKKKFIVLDRPNPISGNLAFGEGPILDEKNCSSFIGRWSIPLRHSCTIGELALYFNQNKNIGAEVEIIKCKNWKRKMFQPDWAIPFVATSPAIQNFNAMLLYPGLVFFEASNISAGRGTNKAFQLIGAPWLNTESVIATIHSQYKDLLITKAIQFIPTESKYANEMCNGILFKVIDANNFEAIKFGFFLIKTIKDSHPEKFNWNVYPTNVNPTGKNHLDKLTGIQNSEILFEKNYSTFKQMVESLTIIHDWKQTIKPYLLY